MKRASHQTCSFLVRVTGLEPRRHKLRIIRVCALFTFLSQTLIHYAVPPFPKKFSTFRGPRFFLNPCRNQALSYYKKTSLRRDSHLVRVTGLEPARIAPPDPKSGVSASFTIPAYINDAVILLQIRVFFK